MLEPRDRRLFVDSLKPPPGYSLDRAVMTTFSLDLIALLSVPLAFTVFGMKDQGGPPTINPLALLEALRRFSDRITMFCQAGQIADTGHVRHAQLLLGFLENSIIEAVSPRKGAFHPKISILRFVPSEGESLLSEGNEERSVIYRLLCSTRNLTFDSSWDTLLTIEGRLQSQRQKGVARNHKLANFVASLPKMALRPMPEDNSVQIIKIADELRKVKFQEPEGFEDFEFWPIGIEENINYWPFDGYDKTLVMSPFVSDGFLSRLFEKDGYHRLISRYETLESLRIESLESLKETFYLNSNAEVNDENQEIETSNIEPDPQENQKISEPEEQLILGSKIRCQGLHAKLYITDEGRNTHVWTGSANATNAAFDSNVEFLVKLIGKRSLWGVDTFLGRARDAESDEKKNGPLLFKDFLLPYKREELPKRDLVKEKIEQIMRGVRINIANTLMEADIETHTGTPESYSIKIYHKVVNPITWPEGVTILCRPISLRESWSLKLTSPLPRAVAVFKGISFEAITSFFAFETTVESEERVGKEIFVLNIPLHGLPLDRRERILLCSLRNREQLFRYLLMLFAEEDDDMSLIFEAVRNQEERPESEMPFGREFGIALLEPLLKTLDRHPAKLDHIERLIEDLQRTPEGRGLMNEDFINLWDAVNKIRKAVI